MNEIKRIIALAVCAMIITVMLLMAVGAARIEWHRETYTVEQNDTLWGIAGKYCPEDYDRWVWIDEVKSINSISSRIYPGQEIVVLVMDS